MYKLKVKKSFTHEDGRMFLVGHDCNELSAFEVAELVNDLPDNFEAGDEGTREFIEGNPENIQHLADAVKRQRAEAMKEKRSRK